MCQHFTNFFKKKIKNFNVDNNIQMKTQQSNIIIIATIHNARRSSVIFNS